MIKVDSEKHQTIIQGDLESIINETVQVLRAAHALAKRYIGDEADSAEDAEKLADEYIALIFDVYKHAKNLKKGEKVESFQYKKDNTEFEEFLKEKYNL